MTRDGRLTMVGKIVVIALCIYAALIVVPDFVRVFGPIGTLGFTADNSGDVGSVDRSVPDVARSGLRPGDRVDLSRMNCFALQSQRCKDTLAMYGGLGGLQYVRLGMVVRVAFMPGPHSGLAAAARAPNAACRVSASNVYDCTIHAQSYALDIWGRAMLLFDQLAGLGFIAVVTLLVWRKPCLMTAGFFLYGLWFNSGQYFILYAELQQVPALMLVQEFLQSIFQGAGYAGFLYFALRFPNDVTEKHWRPFERAVPYIGGAVTLMTLASFASSYGVGTASLTNVTYYTGYAIDLVVILMLFLRLAHLDPRDRERMRWVVWGCTIGLTAFICADVGESTNLFEPLWGSAGAPEAFSLALYGLNAFVPLAVYHALRSYRVVEVGFAFSRSAIMVLSWAIAVEFLSLVHGVLEHAMPDGERESVIITIGLSVVLTLVFDRLTEVLTTFCDRVFFWKLHDGEQRLKLAERGLEKASSLERVDRTIMEEPVRAFALTSAALFRLDDTSKVFVRVGGAIGWQDAAIERFASDSPILTRLTAGDGVVRVREYPDAIRAQLPREARLPAVAVAVTNGWSIQAVAVFGAHKRGDDLNREELDALRELARAASRAYDRIETLKLKERVADLSRRLEAFAGP